MNDRIEDTTTHPLSASQLDLVTGGLGEIDEKVATAVARVIIREGIKSGDLIPSNAVDRYPCTAN
jgi:hypothetical protein